MCPAGFADHSGNRLFRNNGNRTFTDQTDLAGVRDSGWSWGTTFLDHDNDRDLDLFVTNGWDTTSSDQSHLYRNDNGVFTDISNAAGVTDTGMGRGLLSFDYDNDGDLDVFIVNHGAKPILYRNDGGNDNDWLKIKVQGTDSNRDGIGTFITVDPDDSVVGDEMVREINAGSNFLSQNELTAHFGLGPDSGNIDLITVAWPSGAVQVADKRGGESSFEPGRELPPCPATITPMASSMQPTIVVWRKIGRQQPRPVSLYGGQTLGACARRRRCGSASSTVPEPSTVFLIRDWQSSA